MSENETMDTLDSQMSSSDLTINSKINGFLLETSKWAKFLAIVGFVSIGLLVIGALFLMIAGASTSGIPGFAGSTVFIGIAYLLMALLYYFPTLYLFNFAVKMKIAITNSQQNNLEDSFENLKSVFKFTGILMIVVLSFYILMLLIGLLGLAMM